MRRNFVAQFVQLLKRWLCAARLGVVMEKNWVLSVEHSWLQALQFLVHLISLPRILLRCIGFTGIQKGVVDHTGSRLPTVTVTIFWCEFDFGKCNSSTSATSCKELTHWKRL